MNQLIIVNPKMWPRIVTCVFCVNVFATKVCALLLQSFGLYIVIKTVKSNSDDELSVLAVFSVIFGAILLISCTVKSKAISNFCHSLLLSTCASIVWICFKYSQQFQEFFSHEISMLWVLRDSSKMFSKTVETIQNLVDCCKVHTLVVSNCLLFFFHQHLKFQFSRSTTM